MHALNNSLLFLQQQPVFFLVLAFILGLCVGSFLNVVIYRLPIMLHNDYSRACHEYLEQHNPTRDMALSATAQESEAPAKFNLATPESTCPNCKRAIRAWENIPVFSFILMRGRCAGCNLKISWQYPLVELLMGVLALILASHFGVSYQFLFAFILLAALLALSGIDFKQQLLPDVITLPMMWLGLLISLIGNGVFVSPTHAILGAALAYLVLWSVFWLVKILMGVEGMGYGDFKLLALLGAWLGPLMLPQILLLSACMGALVGIILIISKQRTRQSAIPFGPYLAIAGSISLLYGDELNHLYFGLF